MAESNNRELTLVRVFDAPRELVFKAWTDKELLAQWWGPAGVTNPTCEWDARPGGSINIVMLAGPELGDLQGSEWPMTGTITEVAAPSKLVFNGNAIIDGVAVLENTTTVTLEELDGKTKLTLHVVVTKATTAAEGPLAGMEMGWSQSLDKLVALVETGI
jgi:uncharacterized protein YndB with AHSA1/START domain